MYSCSLNIMCYPACTQQHLHIRVTCAAAVNKAKQYITKLASIH